MMPCFVQVNHPPINTVVNKLKINPFFIGASKMLGKKFRELRKNRKLSIESVAKGITSSSSLQRWESGEGSMPVEKVSQLLVKIHYQLEELDDINKLDVYIDDIEKAYQSNNVEMLKKLSLFLLKAYYTQPKDIHIFLQAAIACNYYMDFTNENLLSKSEIIRLKARFTNIETWSEEDVFFFGNIQLLLSAYDVYKISRSLYSYLIDQNQTGAFYQMSVNTLVNSVFVLLKKKAFKQSDFLLNQVEKLKLSEEYVNEQIRINYAKTVFNYLKTGSTQKMEVFLSGLEQAGLKTAVTDFKRGFSQFKKCID